MVCREEDEEEEKEEEEKEEEEKEEEEDKEYKQRTNSNSLTGPTGVVYINIIIAVDNFKYLY